MFTSLVFQLTATQKTHLPGFTGYFTYAIFLDMISKIDQKLAKKLHDSEIKQFSISPFFYDFSKKYLVAGDECFFRVSFLNIENFTQVLAQLKKGEIKTVRVMDDIFDVSKIHFSTATHKWAKFEDIDHLVKLSNKRFAEIEFNFMTPTFFKKQKRNHFMPSPKAVFNSIARKIKNDIWQKSGLDKGVFDVEKDIVIKRFDNLCSKAVDIEKLKIVGFTGKVVFGYRWFDDLQDRNLEKLRVFNFLARCAFFTGVGAKVAMGFGNVEVKAL